MYSKQKTKKGGLEDWQIIPTIKIVKQYWPDYQITLGDIRNPSSSFVLKFYKDCMENLEAKINFVTRTKPLLNPPLLSDEEILYLKLCRIPTLAAAHFKLGDLYVFEPKRLNQHMFITVHFLIASQSLMDKMVQIYDEAFDVNDQRRIVEEKLNTIKEDKIQGQINLTLSNTELKRVKGLAPAQIPKYQKTLNLIQISEEKCKDSILEAEKLKNEIQNLQEEIQMLEKTQVTLNGKILQEDEYESLKAILKSLEKDDEDLQVDKQETDLLKLNDRAELLQNCVEEAKHLELDDNVFELSEQRQELKNLTKDVEYTREIQEYTEPEITQLKNALDSRVQLLEENLKFTETAHTRSIEKMMIEEIELKNQNVKAIQESVYQINEIKKTKSLLESELEKLEHSYIMLKADVGDLIRSLQEAEMKMK